MFVATDENSPLASFICVDDPVKDQARISERCGARLHRQDPRRRRHARSPRQQHRATRRRLLLRARNSCTDFLLPDKKIGAYQVTLADAAAQCDAKLAGRYARAMRRCMRRAVAATQISCTLTSRASARQGAISQ